MAVVWKEWTDGINGGPSVRSLNASWGDKWRTGTKAATMAYSRRNTIWNFIIETANKLKVPEESIVAKMEVFRLEKDFSPSHYTDVIKDNPDKKKKVKATFQELVTEMSK